jgi:hypothetical protein
VLSAPHAATPKKRKKKKSKGRSRSAILQRPERPPESEDSTLSRPEGNDDGAGTTSGGPKKLTFDDTPQRGKSAELGRSLDTILEVAVTEAAELIPVRRVALRSSLGNDDTTVMKRRYSSPAHIPDHQPSSGVSSSYASNSNSYCTTDDDDLSYTSESYYSTDEESGSVEDLASPLYHGKQSTPATTNLNRL